jgi:hypothetical protein
MKDYRVSEYVIRGDNEFCHPVYNVPGTPKKSYWERGELIPVTVRVNAQVWKSLKLMAVREKTSIGDLVGEALVSWMKWLAKASREELEGEAKEAKEKELLELGKLLLKVEDHKAMRVARAGRRDKYERARKSMRQWRKEYPGRPYPGREKIPEETDRLNAPG